METEAAQIELSVLSLSIYICICTCVGLHVRILCSIKFNKILCLCVCLPLSTIPLSRLPSGQNVTTPNVGFLTVRSLIPLLYFCILKLELFQ